MTEINGTKQEHDLELLDRRQLLYATTVVGAASITGVGGIGTVSADEDEEEDEDESGEETEEESEENIEGECEGAPTMSQTSVTTPNSRITTDDPAVVEANFRPDPTIPDNCKIMVDLEFSFDDAGFQWGGGADWDQATSDLVVGTFEVNPGEIRDIRAELHTQSAEAGDQVTVVADYELWFKGNIENSVQQSGIRHTIEVENPNPYNEEEEDNTSFADSLPGFGFVGALTGLGGAGYLLKQRLTGSATQEE